MGMAFRHATTRWFSQTFGEPTPVQAAAWPAIAAGRHVLVSAPTGTGKTLAAFLALIDGLKSQAEAGALPDTVQVIYLSPLKSLAADIRENLSRPLDGVGGPELRVGIRTGDTPSAERQRMLKKPPHILVTTPESLYLLLTTEKGRAMLSTARAVIVDELHALISTKRGAHLMLSLARLDALKSRPVQRIGLSATLKPLDLAAEYLAPGADVEIVAPKAEKRAAIAVEGLSIAPRAGRPGTVWEPLAARVIELCEGRRAVIAFLEGRAQAERLAGAVNAIAGDGFALTHHGSVSREKRQAAEDALRSGRLRLLCATSSMELGIDVGDVDLVVQIGCPGTVSAALQRMGRAGHAPGRVSVMHIFPKTGPDALFGGLTADAALDGDIEPARPPEGCIDVLAQHLTSMASDDRYTVDEALAVAQSAYPTRHATRADVVSILKMLAGDWEHAQDRPARARILFDRIHETVTGDDYTKRLALTAGGTIPDRGMFPAVLTSGVRVGELDEEFVFESRVGDRFLLGAFAWRIDEIRRDRVVVSASSAAGAQTPFWRGDGVGRDFGISKRFGKTLRALSESNDIEAALRDLTLDAAAAEDAARFIERQIDATGCLPDDRTIVVERFPGEGGEPQWMAHSIFGRRVNDALSLLAQRAAAEATGADVKAWCDDNGFLLSAPGADSLPRGLIQSVDPDAAEAILTAMLPATPLFAMAFRYNAARALMMGMRSGQRQPLWIQRIRAAEALGDVARDPDHPLMRETLRECLRDYFDLDALREVLNDVRAGRIAVREIDVETPSPMALPMRRQLEAELMYDYAPATASVRRASEDAVERALKAAEGVEPDEAFLIAPIKSPRDAEHLHSLMMAEGDLAAGDVDAPAAWFDILCREGRCVSIAPGLFVAAEQAELYRCALQGGDLDAQTFILRRCLRFRGGQDSEALRARYGFDPDPALHALEISGEAVRAGEIWHHAEIFARARRKTAMARRAAVQTLPPERYAALLARGLRAPGRPADQLRDAVAALSGRAFPIRQWEEQLFPARVNGYRPALIDALIAEGEWFWRMEGGALAFHRTSEIDWDAPVSIDSEDEDEAALLGALSRRGASFSAALGGLTKKPAVEVLIALAQKGRVRADSFAPLRAMLALESLQSAPPRQRLRALNAAAQAGRWEISRPLAARSDEALLEEDFDERKLICRETALRVPWTRAIEILRAREFSGRARRGYFVEGLSGIQFIREADYPAVSAGLNALGDDPVWLHANDPNQAWGNILPHAEGRAFTCVPGAAVCLVDGRAAAVLDRGERLRLFEPERAEAVLTALARDFLRGGIYHTRDRLTLKSGTEALAPALKAAGFTPEALDWTLWKPLT